MSSTVKIVLVWSEPSKFISSDFLATSNKLLVFLRIDETLSELVDGGENAKEEQKAQASGSISRTVPFTYLSRTSRR